MQTPRSLIDRNPVISVKLSALHPCFTSKVGMTIDAEESSRPCDDRPPYLY